MAEISAIMGEHKGAIEPKNYLNLQLINRMNAKTKELIAVGASVTEICVPCLKYHSSQARAFGATEDEVRQAISIGQMVQKGAASKRQEEADALCGKAQ